jgi:hypothetical protein
MWLALGFGAMGLLVGSLVGLTAEAVVMPLIGLLFAFIGTSILAMLHKLSADDRKAAGMAILALSIFCLVGVYSGILATEHQILTPISKRGEKAAAKESPAPASESKPPAAKSEADAKSVTEVKRSPYLYLRSDEVEAANAIDILKSQSKITTEEAYERMYRLALTEARTTSTGDTK